MITKNVGGDRLGSGSKLTTRLHGYERSTHDLGKVFRSTMTQGTLVPCYVNFVQKGDVWDIDLESLVRTHPTNGPIFGTYKMQVDVFTADIRLYNKQLHNNTTGLGMNMANVKFPMMRLRGVNPSNGADLNQQQVAPDSLLAYLGIRGLGTKETLGNQVPITIFRNAMPLMAYWDIYKEYYANKQEEVGYAVGIGTIREAVADITSYTTANNTSEWEWQNDDSDNHSGGKNYVTPGYSRNMKVYGTNVSPDNVMANFTNDITSEGGTNFEPKTLREAFESVVVNAERTEVICYQCQYSAIEVRNINGVKSIFYASGETEPGTDGISLVEFPLSNIDDVREKVFEKDKASPLIIGHRTGPVDTDDVTWTPYELTTGLSDITGGDSDPVPGKAAFTMCGLGIKTYQSDRFNNWLATEWIEAINSISSVSTATGSFTMDALNLAKKVYELENRVAVSGGTYQDWLEAVYGEKTSGAAEMPVYRGGMSSEIVFDEVVSSSDATTAQGFDQPLGTLGGRGTQSMKKGGSIRFRAEEHGWVMIIVSITPRIDYHQGNQWFMKLGTMDDIHKPQLDSIGFQELLTDEAAAWDTVVISDGVEEFHSFGKQPSWTQYTTNWNEVYGNFARENAEQWMTLTRRYENNEAGRITDATTYIDPTKFNYPFANLELESQPFWVQIGIDAKVRRLMSAIQMPNL